MDTNQLLVVLIGWCFIIALVGIVCTFLHYRRERMLTHQERLKALELCRDLPDSVATTRIKAVLGLASGGEKTDSDDGGEGSSGSLSRKGFSTAVWVAFWGFLAASQSTTMANSPGSVAISIAIAASAAAIGVAAVICATVLAMRQAGTPHSSARGKPAMESDALDVVSRRG